MRERERNIWTAAIENDCKLMASLLDKNPELIASRDSHQWTPLHRATACSSMEVMELLLLRGAEVNARGQAEETPLHLADNEATTWLLIRYGADPRLEDRNQMTPLDFVREERQPVLYDMLCQAVAQLDLMPRTTSTN